jgi:hypothetical protein
MDPPTESVVAGAADTRPGGRVAVAAVLAAAFALACASGIPGLGDNDPYRHLAYAAAVWRTGFTLRGWPMLPYTLLGDTGVDLWWGFHRLLIPFTALGTLWGARLAGACIAAAVAASIAWMLRRSGQPRAAWFALAPLAFSFFTAYRAQLARPAALTVPLALACLVAAAGELGPGFALAASFAYGLLHLSAPLSVFFALVGFAGARLGGGKGSARAVLWSIGGLAAGILARPDRAFYLPVAFLTSANALGADSGMSGMGAELRSLPVSDLAFEIWAGCGLLALAVVLSRSQQPAGSRPLRSAALLAVAATVALTLWSARFLEYCPALLAFAAGILWPGERLRSVPGRWAAWTAAAALIALAGRNLHLAWEEGSFTGTPALYERLAVAVRQRVPGGAVLFTDDLFRTAPIFASLPEYRYLAMADPSLLYASSPLDYYRWLHAVEDGNLCEAPACPGKTIAPRGLVRAIASFGSEWAITSRPARASLQVQAMLGAPLLFEPVWSGQDSDAGFVLWHLKRLALPMATTSISR